MIETLLDVMRESRLDTDLQKMLLPVIIGRISQLLRDCEAACLRAETYLYDVLLVLDLGFSTPIAL